MIRVIKNTRAILLSQMGKLLYSSQIGEPAKALFPSILRTQAESSTNTQKIHQLMISALKLSKPCADQKLLLKLTELDNSLIILMDELTAGIIQPHPLLFQALKILDDSLTTSAPAFEYFYATHKQVLIKPPALSEQKTPTPAELNLFASFVTHSNVAHETKHQVITPTAAAQQKKITHGIQGVKRKAENDAKNHQAKRSRSSSSGPALKDFYVLNEVNAERKGEFSHTTYRGRKFEKDDVPSGSKRNENIWYLKFDANTKTCHHEIFAQRFARLLNPNYPKTHYLRDDEGHIVGVASKEIINGKKLAVINTDELKASLKSGKTFGLAAAGIIALTVSERDFRFENIFSVNGEIIKFDGDYCFAHLRPQDAFKGNYSFTNKDIQGDKFDQYKPFNWLDIVNSGKTKESNIIDTDLVSSPHWRHETNLTIMQILVLPKTFLQTFAGLAIEDDKAYAEKLCTDTLHNIQLLRSAALQDPSFKNYLQTDEARHDLAKHIAQLKTATIKGKKKIWDQVPGIGNYIQKEFTDLKAVAGFKLRHEKELKEATPINVDANPVPSLATPPLVPFNAGAMFFKLPTMQLTSVGNEVKKSARTPFQSG